MEKTQGKGTTEALAVNDPLNKARVILDRMANRQSHLQETFDKMVKKDDG